MPKSKKLRRSVERLYAELNNVSVEHAQHKLAQNKELYEDYKRILTDGRYSSQVAALFVQSDGCYVDEPLIDAWPEGRDARLYNGTYPVVAHPPCQRYGNLGRANYARWGGEHNRPLNDGGCFAAALAAVNCWGGVLEHPAFSMAWDVYNLEKPVKGAWVPSGVGWVCEVWQSAYGHKARKRTWLYWRGFGAEPFDLNWERPTGTHQIGFYDQRGKAANKPTLNKHEANATPLEFRDELLRLARHSTT